MARYLKMILAAGLVVALISGCGGGAGSMMLKILTPLAGSTCSGNQTVTASMLNPAMATKVNFQINGTTFSTVDPALTMTARLDTLSMGLPNGTAHIIVQSTGNVYTSSESINVNNPRSLFVQDVSGAQGSYVTVHVKLNDFSSVAGYHIWLDYDKNKLTLQTSSVAKGAGVPTASNFTPNTGTLGILEAVVTGTGLFTNGDVLVANFQIKTPSASGTENAITVDTPALTNASGGSITVTGVTGYVTTN